MHKIDYDRYEIHENGNVFDKKIKRFLKPHKCAGNYLQLHLSGKRYYAHVIVARKFIPNPQGKPEVNHKDGNKMNNHVSNLEWVTRKENMIHAQLMGIGPRRNARNLTKYVDDIRLEYDNGGISMQKIANKYGVSYSVIFKIIHKTALIYA